MKMIHGFDENNQRYISSRRVRMARAALRARRSERNHATTPAPAVSSRRSVIRLGFISLVDAAPILMALELGLFRAHGINVELQRVAGWATVRDKVIYGELDAAQAPAPMVVSTSLGIGSVKKECLAGIVLNLHGNAITLSRRLWDGGVRNGATLRRFIDDRREKLTLGVPAIFSSHHFLLRRWLAEARIDADEDVRLALVPPAQMFANLTGGHLDGYCVGEPWNSLAVISGEGWVPAASMDIAPNHPEKVLMVPREFAEKRPEEHLGLLAALLEACRFCDHPQHRERIAETIAQSEFLNAPVQAVRMSLAGKFDFGNGRVEKCTDIHIFARRNANEPSPDKAQWVSDEMLASGAVADPALISPETMAGAFRPDLYAQAAARTPANLKDDQA